MNLTTLSGLIRGSNFAPMSREEYETTTRPRPHSKPVFAEDKARMSPLAEFLSRFSSSGSSKTLVRSIAPTSEALGLSSGLYAGVGQLPAYKVQSLISEYV